MIDLLDFIRPIVLAQQGLVVGMLSCSGGCGALLPKIAEDVTDPAIRAMGRQCQACYERQERDRAHE